MPGQNRNTRAIQRIQNPNLEGENSTSLEEEVKKLLKERAERFRITSSLLEDHEDDSHSDIMQRLSRLGKLEEPEPTIEFGRKGLVLFNVRNSFKLYDEATAHRTFLESKIESDVDHPIYKVSMEDLNKTIRLRLFKAPMKNQSILNNLFSYIFKMMCVSKDLFMIASCFNLLVHQLDNYQGEVKSWAPTIDDIVHTFKNYGAADAMFHDEVQLEDVGEEAENSFSNNLKYNIFRVVKFLGHLLASKSYSEEDLDKLLIIILSVSLDHNFMGILSPGVVDITRCLTVILHSYEESVWTRGGKISDLCKKIHSKFNQIDAKEWYHIIVYSIYSPGIGNNIGYSLTYILLRYSLCQDIPEDCENYSLKDIIKAVKRNNFCKLKATDQYHFILLLRRLVSRMILSPENKEHLEQVFDMLSYLRVNEETDVVGYHLIKELLTETKCMWRHYISDVKTSA